VSDRELPKWMQERGRKFVVYETKWPHNPHKLATFHDYNQARAYMRKRPNREIWEIYVRFEDKEAHGE